MRRLPLALLLLALAVDLAAQSTPQPPIPGSTLTAREPLPLPPSFIVPASDSPAAPSVTPPARALSVETSAKISATSPKFTPAKRNEVKPEELPDLREIDKPRNGIIRLPQVLVQEQKGPLMKERDLLTPEGKLDLAYQRNPGLRLGSLSSASNNDIALDMLEEDLRLERIAEATDLTDLYRYSDPRTGAAMKALTIPLYRRSSEWVEAPKGANAGHAISKLK